MELSEHLKEHRHRLGLSQESVANQIYVSRQTLSNWETGKTYPDVQSLLLLSQLFDVSIDELVKGDLAVMNEKVNNDARTLKRLGLAMLLFMVAAFVAGAIAIIVRDIGPTTQYGISIVCACAILLACALFLCAFAAAVWAEVLKHQNNVVTFREIIAFEEGIPLDEVKNDDALGRKHPIFSTTIKLCSGAIFGLIAVVLFSVIAKTIRDVIFAAISA